MSAVEERAAKKAKTTFTLDDHKMNVRHALDKDQDGKTLHELVDAKVEVLNGLGEVAEEMMEALGVTSIGQLATWKFGRWAHAITVLAELEDTKTETRTASALNIDKALDKDFETKSFTELLEAPVSAFQGLTEKADKVLQHHNITTIGKLGKWKFLQWARAFADLVDAEETKSPEELKLERELRRLS